MRLSRASALVAGLGLLLIAWAFAEAGGAELAGRAFAEAAGWISAQQRSLHRELTAAIRAVATDATAQWALVGISFGYGVFHAAGPGHGKAVLTTYLVTHPEHAARGVLLAVASALCQGLVAIALVYGLVMAAGWIPRDVSKAVTWAERASFILVMAMGALLLARAAASVWRRLNAPVHGDGRHHEHAACDHAHGPTGDQIARSGNVLTALGVVLSIGIRPCTGAILVLVLAHVLGLAVVGALAVLAMSAGTAITVAVLAFGSVHLRGWIGRLAAGRGSGWLVSLDLLAASGGVFLLATGYALLAGSWGPAHPLGF